MSKVKKHIKHRPLKITIIVVLFIFILYWFLSFSIVYILESNLFARVELPKSEDTSLRFFGDYEKMKDDKFTRREIEFESDKNNLRGYDYGYNLEDRKGLFVLSHGFSSNQLAYLYMAKYLVNNGYEVITYDNTGTVKSDGKDMIALSHSPIDLYHCLKFVESDTSYENLELYLLGHSWGGYAVTNVFNFEDLPNIKGVVAFSGFDYSPTMLPQFGISAHIAPAPIINLLNPAITIYEYIKTGNQAFKHSYTGINNHPETKFMIVHGIEDDLIPITHCSVYSEKDKITNPNTIFVPLEGKDHSHVFMTILAKDYDEEIEEQSQLLQKQYKGEELKEKLLELKTSVDVDKVNELDIPMLDSLINQVTN